MELGTRCPRHRPDDAARRTPKLRDRRGPPYAVPLAGRAWPPPSRRPGSAEWGARGEPLSVPLGEAQSPLRSRGASLTIVLTIISVRSGDRAWLSAPSCPAEPRPTALPELGRGCSGRRPWLHLSRMWTLKFGGAQDSSSQAPGGQCWVGLDADRGSEACRKRRSSGE